MNKSLSLRADLWVVYGLNYNEGGSKDAGKDSQQRQIQAVYTAGKSEVGTQ